MQTIMATFSFDDVDGLIDLEHEIDFEETDIIPVEKSLAPRDVWAAAQQNDMDALRSLLEGEQGNSVDEVNGAGVTPLHLCASLGHTKMAQYLISKGADIHARDFESGWTPLHFALYNKRVGLALVLMEHGADLDVPAKGMRRGGGTDRDGNTPLDLVSLPLTGMLQDGEGGGCADQIGNVFTFGQCQSQLGYGLFGVAHVQKSPRRVDALSAETVVKIAAAKYTTFAITKEGELYAWGIGACGRLGTGNIKTHISPILVQGPFVHRKVRFVAAAKHHTLAITGEGKLFTWGGQRYGKLGQGPRCAEENGICLTPRMVEGELRNKEVVSIAAGLSHSVAVTKEGVLYTWGSNAEGQLGHRAAMLTGRPRSNSGSDQRTGLISSSYLTQLNWPLPTRVAALSVRKRDGSQRAVKHIAANDFTSCVVESSGRVWAWGHKQPVPTRVNFPDQHEPHRFGGLATTSQKNIYVIPRAMFIEDVACALDHNVARSKSGEVLMWSSRPEQSSTGPIGATSAVVPMPVKGLSGKHVVKIAAGKTHVCAVVDTGDLFTWCPSADGNTAALGHRDKGGGRSPTVPQCAHTLKRVTEVACGSTHTVALVTLARPALRLGGVEGTRAALGLNEKAESVYSVDDDEEPEASMNTSLGETDTEDDTLNISGGSDSSFSIIGGDGSGDVFDVDPITPVESSDQEVPTLERLCEITLAKTVDAHNIADILAYAEAFNCDLLATYCKDFLFLNMDAVFAAARPRELNILMYQTSVGLIGTEDEELIFNYNFNKEFFDLEPRIESTNVNSEENLPSFTVPRNDSLRSEETKDLCALPPTQASVQTVLRRVKTTRKKLAVIARQEKIPRKNLSEEQIVKIARKTQLAKELKDLEEWLLLSPELVEEERRRKELRKKKFEQDNIEKNKQSIQAASEHGRLKVAVNIGSTGGQLCKMCNVELVDDAALLVHNNSKRHKKEAQKTVGQQTKIVAEKVKEILTPCRNNRSDRTGPSPMKTPGSVHSPPELKRRLSWNTTESFPTTPPKASLLSIMMQEAENKQPMIEQKQRRFSGDRGTEIRRVSSGDHTLAAPPQSKQQGKGAAISSPISIPGGRQCLGRVAGSFGKSPSSLNKNVTLLGKSPPPYKSNAFTPSHKANFPVPSLDRVTSSSPNQHGSMSLIDFIPGKKTPKKISQSPAWGAAAISTSTRSSAASVNSPPKVGFMDIMNMEAKKKKEEKYTIDRNRHHTKWYQRDEDTKQESLEAIMRAEKEERDNLEVARRLQEEENKAKERTKRERSRRNSGKKTHHSSKASGKTQCSQKDGTKGSGEGRTRANRRKQSRGQRGAKETVAGWHYPKHMGI